MSPRAQLLDLLEAVVDLLHFALAAVLDVDEFVAGPVGGGEEFVELDLEREHALALRPLDEEQEDERSHGDELIDALVGPGPADERDGDGPGREDSEEDDRPPGAAH